MRSLPLLVAALLASVGLAAAQDYQSNPSGPSGTYYPPPAGSMISLRIYVEETGVVAFRGNDVWLVHESTQRRHTDYRAEVFLNGHPWLPKFDNGTCPCFSQTFHAGDKIPYVHEKGDYDLRVHNGRGAVKIDEQPSLGAGVLRVRIDDSATGGEWYGIELFERGARTQPYPPQHGRDDLRIRFLVDGFATLSMKGKEGWVTIESGKIPHTQEAMLYFNEHPVRLQFAHADSTAVAACPCKSQVFPLPFLGPDDEGIAPDDVGAIYFWEGRGAVKISEQPRDGNGVFRLAIDDSPFENPYWYHLVIGGDPAYDKDDCTYTDASGAVYPCHRPTSPCEPLPPEAANWTEEARKKWYYEHCYRDAQPPPAHPACPYPPEARSWTDAQRREFEARCRQPCGPGPEAQYWSEEARRAWYEKNCGQHDGGCNPPADWSNWPDGQRHSYVVERCGYPATCPAPARHLNTANEPERNAWMKANCPNYSQPPGGGDPWSQVRDLASNKTLQEEAKKALQNGTDPNKIVVPGFEPVLALLGLAAMAFVAGRRR